MNKPYSLYNHLIDVARKKSGNEGLITYGELAPILNLNMDKREDRNEIGNMLGEISRYEHEQGRPMLSVVVIHKDDPYPGPGFFKLARELGVYRGTDDIGFFVKELTAVHAYWKTH